MLKSPARDYVKLTEFTKIVVSVDSDAPPLQFWNLDDLFRHWGVASEFLHFSARTRPTTLRLIGRLKQSAGLIQCCLPYGVQ